MFKNKERKKRKESGLRRIFERSVKELKTEAHTENEDRSYLPVLPQIWHPVSEILQNSKKTDDKSKEKRWEGQKSVSEMAKNVKIYCASEDELKTNDIEEKSKIINETSTSFNANLQQKENIRTSFEQKENSNFPVMEDKENTSDSQSNKTFLKNSNNKQREKARQARKSRLKLKENTERRMIYETKSNKSNQLIKRRDISSMTREESRGQVSRSRDSDGRGKRERERLKTEELSLNRSNRKRKDHKPGVRTETTTECEDNKRHHRDRQECGALSCHEEDWMPDLLDLPYLDPAEVIIPRRNLLQESAPYKECSQTAEAKHQIIDEKNDELESIRADVNYMGDRGNHNSCKEPISKLAVGIHIDVKNDIENEGLDKLFDSVLHFEKQWECQEIPNVTMKLLDENKFFPPRKPDVKLTESILDYIEEDSDTFSKETSVNEKHKQIYHMQKMEKTVCSEEVVKTGDSNELLQNIKDKPVIRKIDQASQENRQRKMSLQTGSKDWLSTMASKDKQGKKSNFTKDVCFKNDSYMETINITGNTKGKISKEDKNKPYDEGCYKDSSDSLAAEESSSVSSKPIVSSFEDWSSEYLDSEEHSDTYHKILQDKIVALKSRIPTKLSTCHKGQVRGSRSRQDKHSQRLSPFQLYLKTIHFEDGTSIDQNNSPDYYAVNGAKFKEDDHTERKIEGDKTNSSQGRENFLGRKTGKGYHSPVCTKSSFGVDSKLSYQPPGFLVSLPSHSLVDTEQAMSSQVPLFCENEENTMGKLEKHEKLHGSISREHKESEVELSSLSATFCGLDSDSTFEQKEVIKALRKTDDLNSIREDWENNLYDVDTKVELLISDKLSADVAVVPGTKIVEERLCKESSVEQCVPKDQEALNSSMESFSFPHFFNRFSGSQNTLGKIPSISENENSMKDEDLASKYEDSLEDEAHQSSPQSVFIPTEESSSSCSNSSRQYYEHFQKALARREGKRLLSSSSRKRALERKRDPRKRLSCQCPSDYVHFLMYRRCLCQDPYLYSIQGANEEKRPISTSESLTPDESGKVLDKDMNSRRISQQKEKSFSRNRDLSSDNTPSPYWPRELGTERSAISSNRKQGGYSSLDLNNSSNGTDQDNEILKLTDRDSYELTDRDSSESFSVEAELGDSPSSEEADDSEYNAEAEQEKYMPYHYMASYPPTPVVNYMSCPPGYNYYPTYPTAYPGTYAGLGRNYPGLYPDPYEPYLPVYMSGRFSRQQFVDGQMYPDHPGYLPPMFYPQLTMVSGWKEMSVHHGEPCLGFNPRYIYQLSHEGHEISTGRCRGESDSHGSNSRDAGRGDVEEDDGHHYNILASHNGIRKKSNTAGRCLGKISSIITEQSPNGNLYIPPHKRTPNMHGLSVDRENRSKNNREISTPSSYLYQNSEEIAQAWREGKSQVDSSFDQESDKVTHGRSQKNRVLSCPTTWECNSSAPNNRPFASVHYDWQHEQNGQGRNVPTDMSQGAPASEDEPSGCDLLFVSSSEDSTPRSRSYKFSDQKQSVEKYPETVTLDWKSAFLERCSAYGIGYIDSHCHIDFLFNRLDFKGKWSDFKAQNMKTFPSSYLGCVAVFCNPNSFKQEGLWKRLSKEENVWLTFGCHPKNARDFTKWNVEGLRMCLRNNRVVALGEIGLDYSGSFVETKELQKSVFKKQIRMALDMRKALVIHCREAEKDCLDILRQMVPRHYKIHCHCFTGDFTSAKLWLNHFPNLYIGLTPLVTYRTAKGARDVAKLIPLRRLLLESDAPYFVPRTIPKESMNFSHPGLCVMVAEEVARLKNIRVQEVLKACLENTRDMYNI